MCVRIKYYILMALTMATVLTGGLEATAGTLTYEYDKLNRPIKETYSDGAVVNYTYDEFGNRRQVYLSPFVDFKGTPVREYPPFVASFTDLSPGNPTSWRWDFGDGGTSTLQNPSP